MSSSHLLAGLAAAWLALHYCEDLGSGAGHENPDCSPGPATASAWLGRRWQQWWGVDRVETGESAEVSHLLEAEPADVSETTSENWGGGETVVVAPSRYVVTVVAELKIRYPYSSLENTVADNQSIKMAANQIFLRDNLRIVDRVKYMPLVTALMFQPSREEQLEMRLLRSRAAVDNIAEYRSGVYDHWLDRLTGGVRRFNFSRK